MALRCAPWRGRKTSTAAELARWYWGADAVPWSSFERPIGLLRLLDQPADAFADALSAKVLTRLSGPGSDPTGRGALDR